MRRYIVAVGLLWTLMVGIAIPYAMLQRVPAGVAVPVAAAFLIEAALYLLMAFPVVRETLSRGVRPPILAGLLALSGGISYLVYSVGTGRFRWDSLGLILSLSVLVSFWYLWTPRAAWSDLLFVAAVASVTLLKVFPAIYSPPWEKVETSALGQLMWLRVGMLSVLWFRRMEGVGFGFWPRKREWGIGLRHFLYFIPLAAVLGYAMGYISYRPPAGDWWMALLKALAVFAGMMWVVALGEEFFFRGLLQQWLSGWLGSEKWGLVLAAVLFGCAHLPFRAFPNWKFAILAAVAGWFYGRAFQQAHSIRAAMVTHALTNVVFRTFFVSG